MKPSCAFTRGLGPSLLLFVIACAPSEEVAQSGDDLQVDPVAVNGTGASFIAHAPAADEPLSASIRLGSQTVSVGLEQLSEAPLGTFRYSGTTKNPKGVSYTFEGSLTAAVGDTKELGFGVAQVARPAAFTAGLDRAVIADTKNAAASLGLNDSSLTIGMNLSGPASIAVLPGRYDFHWGINDGAVFDVTAGQTTSFALQAIAQREIARLEASPATKPNACKGLLTLAYTVNGTPKQTNVYPFTYPIEIGRNPDTVSAPSLATLPIDVKLPCVNRTFRLEYGAKGAGPRATQLGRIDVSHIAFPMSDGSVEHRIGRYTILGTDGAEVAGPFLTDSGIDLPAGTYRVVVSYQTSVGDPATYEQTVTTP